MIRPQNAGCETSWSPVLPGRSPASSPLQPAHAHGKAPVRHSELVAHLTEGLVVKVRPAITRPPLPLHSGVPETHRVSLAIMAAPLRRPLELAHLPSTGGIFREW